MQLIHHSFTNQLSVVIVLVAGIFFVAIASLDFHLPFLYTIFSIQNSASDKSSGQINCREVISSADLVKTNNTVNCDSILEQNNGG